MKDNQSRWTNTAGSIRKKKHKKPEKYQGLKEKVESMCRMKASIVLVVTGSLGTVTSELREWIQPAPVKTSEISDQRSAGQLRYSAGASIPQASGRRPSLKQDYTTNRGE